MRGGRLFLLLGVVIAAAAALLLFYFTQQSAQQPPEVVTTPTAVPKVKVVVARVDLPVNALISDTELLTTDEMPEPDFNSQPGTYFTNASDLINKVTLRPLLANERIKKSDVTDGGLSLLLPTAEPDQPRPKAIPFQVNNLTGVADLVKPGDFVDLIATFQIETKYIRPTIQLDQETKTFFVTFVDDTFTDASTKTLVQNIQVLKILRQRADPDTTPTPEGQAPASDAPPATNPDGSVVGQNTGGQPTGDDFVSGNWLLVLAVTDQEAEIIRYSTQRAAAVGLVLRGRGDADVEQTLGVTLEILFKEFGLPAPVPVRVPPVAVDALTPVPSR